MKTEQTRNAGSASRLAALGLVCLLFLGGCKKHSGNNTAATPSGQEPAAAAPAPAAGQAMTAAPQPSPAPPPSPQVYTVASGARLAVRVSQTLSAKENNVGDNFRGVLARSVRVGGVPVLPAGTPVVGTVVAARGQGKFKGAGVLAIALNRVGSQVVTTTSYEKTRSGKGKRSLSLISGGGGGGALLGGLAGGGRGALIGGLVGAGAGTAGAAYTGNKNVSIPAESVVSFTLTSPLTVTLQPPETTGKGQPQQ